MRFKIVHRGEQGTYVAISTAEPGDNGEIERAEAAGAALRAKQESDRIKESRFGPLADALDDAAIEALWPHLEPLTRDQLQRTKRARPWPFSIRWGLITGLARQRANEDASRV